MEIPFQIGQVMWQATTTPTRVDIPCPACFDKLRVTLILGNGEHVSLQCDACEGGIGTGSTGRVHEYVYEPGAKRFVIAKINSMHQGRWTVISEDGDFAVFSDLLPSEDDALADSQRRCAEHAEESMRRSQNRRTRSAKPWSVRYHRERIKKLERELEWHRSKIVTLKESA